MTSQPRLVLTAEDPSFDSVTIQNWKDEGYDVTYLPFTGSRPDFERNLQHLTDPLETGEKYAIVGVLLSCNISPKHPNSTKKSEDGALLHLSFVHSEGKRKLTANMSRVQRTANPRPWLWIRASNRCRSCALSSPTIPTGSLRLPRASPRVSVS